jgi:hypothetical protein
MLVNALQWIIVKEFDLAVGKSQEPIFSDKSSPEFWAMDLKFSLYPYYERQEQGYRHLFIRIYAPLNYVAVTVKEDWTVINSNDVDDLNDCLMPGKKYTEGDTGWMLASYHDSCWATDGIERILHAYENRIASIDSFDHWYKKVNLTEAQRREIQTLVKERDHGEFKHHWGIEKIAGVIV